MRCTHAAVSFIHECMSVSYLHIDSPSTFLDACLDQSDEEEQEQRDAGKSAMSFECE